MANLEHGYKWWLRYIIVPLLGGGGIVVALFTYISRPQPAPNAQSPVTQDAGSAISDSQEQKPMDFYLKWNTVVPGPLLKQYRFSDADYNSCMQECENNPKCVAWVFGPMPLPTGVKYNCGLKFAVTGTRIYQKDVVSGYSSRYRPSTQ